MAKLWRKLKWLVFFWDTVYNHNVLMIALSGCQTQSCSFDRDISSKTKTKTATLKTKTKTSKNCLKAVLRQDTVSRLNITEFQNSKHTTT